MGGKPAALELLYRDLVRQHSARVWRLAYRLTGRREEAEDLTQEAFYEAWRSIASLRAPEAGRGWLVSILMHRASRRLRREGRRPVVERSIDEGVDASALPGPDLDLLGRREDIQRALDRLDPDRRVAFLLVFLEGLTCREAAERLDIPLGTVLSRIHRARADLRGHLRHLRDGEDGEAGRPHTRRTHGGSA